MNRKIKKNSVSTIHIFSLEFLRALKFSINAWTIRSLYIITSNNVKNSRFARIVEKKRSYYIDALRSDTFLLFLFLFVFFILHVPKPIFLGQKLIEFLKAGLVLIQPLDLSIAVIVKQRWKEGGEAAKAQGIQETRFREPVPVGEGAYVR